MTEAIVGCRPLGFAPLQEVLLSAVVIGGRRMVMGMVVGEIRDRGMMIDGAGKALWSTACLDKRLTSV